MPGEKDLGTLLGSLSATLDERTYVFATVADDRLPENLQPLLLFREAEGTTLILEKSQAEALGMNHAFPCKMITLNVHSSLEAVGFIAHIASELAAHGMGVNPVSAFYHDHLFIPEGREDEAMRILARIAERAGPAE